MASFKNITDDSPTNLPQSPQGLAIRDPGVMSSSHSFTDIEFANRHTVDVGIGNIYGDVKLAGKGREKKHHHRHHHHHHRGGSVHGDDSSSQSTRKESQDGPRQATRRRSRTRSIRELDSDRPVTPPGERVIRILGEDTSKENIGLTAKPIFSEMEELLWENGDSVWRETARWIRFEEDVEESGDRFSKPHVGTLSLHALFELRSFLLKGALLFDVEGSTLDQISSIVVDRMICTGNLALKHRDSVKETILKRHHHAFEREKKNDDKKRDDERKTGEQTTRSKSEPSGLMKLPIIRSLGSKASFQDNQSDNSLVNNPYLLGKGNIHFMKKVPPGAEACNILVGEVDYLENPIAAFIRLSSANELGDLTEVPVPTRFIFLLLGTVGNLARYHEVGRAMGTLMSDEVFHEIAYKAAKREHIIAGIDEFLDAVTVLPPGEWDPSIRIEPPDHLPSQQGRKHRPNDSCCPNEKVDEEIEELKMRDDAGLVRSGKFFGGLLNDLKRKKPFYLSDFKDASSAQIIASWLFLYFACLTPIVTFGGLLGAGTGQQLAAIESLVSGLICGVVYGFFSGQPLTILGSTGPVLVFEVILYEYCQSVGWEFLPFRLWTGIWVGIILLIMVATDCSAFVCYITRFTEENFLTLIAAIFMFEAIDKLIKIRDNFPIHPPPDGMNCFCKPPTNVTLGSIYDDWSSLSQSNCTEMNGVLSDGCSYEPNVFFMSAVLFILTVIIIFKLKGFKESSFLPTIIRRLVSDFSVIIAIVSMTLLDYFAKVKTPKLIVPEKFAPTWSGRTWLVPILNDNPWWTTLAAIIPAVLATILIFMDQQITAVIVNRRENKLKKGGGYHLDLFIVAILIVICSFLGIPFFVAATVRSINHVNSLKLESETAAPGEKPQFLGVLEQRVTQLLISSTIGISVFLVPILKMIPMPVLYGIFLYMGASGLKGLQLVDRLAIIFMPSKYQPDLPYLRKVPVKRVHIFTAIQFLCLVLLWVIKSIQQTKMLFPVMLVVLIGIRKLLDRYFSREELKALDDILPEFKRKERDEAEEDEDEDECCEGDDKNENAGKPPLSPDGQANLKIPMVSGNIMKISVPVEDPINISEEVKRCGVWKTVNSANELAEKQSHKRHSKKSKRSNSSHKRSHKNPKLSEIEEESFLKASFDKNNEDGDDDESHEFITIKIDKAESNSSLIKENGVTENDEESEDASLVATDPKA